MSIPTVVLNENTPAGNTYKRDGDDRIREFKTQNRQVVGVDHKYESSGQDADMGKHNQVSLLEQDGTGITGATGKPVLYAKTISGKPELVFRNEGNTDVQITSEDALVGATAESIIAIIYPVGGLYTSTLPTNPATLLGVGTWEAFGAGKVPVGIDASDGDFDTVEETGGEKTHKLTGGESGTSAHNHDIPLYSNQVPATKVASSNEVGGTVGDASTTDSTEVDADDAHNNVQPYIVVYVWKRTA